MRPRWQSVLDRLVRERLVPFLGRPTPRYMLAWLLALLIAATSAASAWFSFAAPERRDGNSGHTTIDFGGQWLMGRMLVEGLGQHLYHRNVQRLVLRRAYPREDEAPDEKRPGTERGRSDVENLMGWFLGNDDYNAASTVASFVLPLAVQARVHTAALLLAAQQTWADSALENVCRPSIGGTLYPPVNAFLLYPLGLLPPRTAYRLNQLLNLLLAFVTGWGVRLLARGRIWWPLASAAVIVFPGFTGSFHLGQNATLTLTILVWGWVLLDRGRPGWAGVIWGGLAFKPVWAVAFFLVPVLTRRWRFALAMLLTTSGLAVLTLPVVGWQAWQDWFYVARLGAALYDVDENWIFLSRDLLGIPRRWLQEFPLHERGRASFLATIVGYGLLFSVLLTTAGIALYRRSEAQATLGVPAAFLLLGAWLSCFHFMYYDVLLAALPVSVLFTEPKRYLMSDSYLLVPTADGKQSVGVLLFNSFVLTILVYLLVVEFTFPWLGLEATITADLLKLGQETPPALKLTTHQRGTPWHTFGLLALWGWCGWCWLSSCPAVRRV